MRNVILALPLGMTRIKNAPDESRRCIKSAMWNFEIIRVVFLVTSRATCSGDSMYSSVEHGDLFKVVNFPV